MSSAAPRVMGSRREATPCSVGLNAATDSSGARKLLTPSSAGMSAVVPRVDSPMAAVFVRIESVLPLMASVFWRIVITVEHPGIVTASRSANAFLILMPAPLIPAHSCSLPPAPCPLLIGRNHIRRLFANHVDRACDEQPGHTWEHRSIHNA